MHFLESAQLMSPVAYFIVRINDTDITPLITLGKAPEVVVKGKLVKPKQAAGTTCYDIHATDEWLIYIGVSGLGH